MYTSTHNNNISVRRFRSDRVLQAHVGHVAADSGVLHVLTVLGCDVFKGAVPDGPLHTKALHLVHVDWTHSWTEITQLRLMVFFVRQDVNTA